MSESWSISMAERGWVPLPALRVGVRRQLRQRLREAQRQPDVSTFVEELKESPVALSPEKANEQHYEVPPDFFEAVLGPNLKYSGAWWPDGVRTLGEAEEAMLGLTCKRAELEDGQDILELGCGWGSLTLHMARRYPNSRITAVSNSAPQRRFIEERAPGNVRVVTADMNDLTLPADSFDRVVSVEMFEHMRNYRALFGRIHEWIRPGGRLFVHVFCHKAFAYPYEARGKDNWMARHFFTGGIMPSFDLLTRFDDHFDADAQWVVPGEHYSLTARAWRENLERRRSLVRPILRETYGDDADLWYHRWRLFFLACEELFGYQDGTEWHVGHYRFAPKVL